ncbi:MAG: hypothetical protein IPP88_17775 [Betaproteobacteria bacterium]|nr:hypothetical protein [Betaproteobacteria bacterium]
MINLAAVAPPATRPCKKATPGVGIAFFDFTPSIDDGNECFQRYAHVQSRSLTVGGVISPIILSGMTI